MMNNVPPWSEIETLLCGPRGDDCLALLHHLNRRFPIGPDDCALIETMTSVGLCEKLHDGVVLTVLGMKCADSAREYLFWRDRGRKFHGEDSKPALRLENFRDKDVVEFGAGWGCNLVRIGTVARRAVGVEIEPVYVALSSILARREDLRPPDLRLGTAESTPFETGQFDSVLIWSAIQYTDIARTFREAARLLRPGGQVLTSASGLSTYCLNELRCFKKDPRIHLLKTVALTLTNTLWYRAFGKRLFANSTSFSTARPIYLPISFLVRMAAREGLRNCDDLTVHEDTMTILVLRKLSPPPATLPDRNVHDGSIWPGKG